MSLSSCIFEMVDWQCDGSAPIDYRNLPIASIETLDKIADADKDNYKRMLEAIAHLAAERIRQDLTSQIDFRSNVSQYGGGCWGVPTTATTTYNGQQGITFKLRSSRYLQLFLRELIFYSTAPQTIQYEVRDQFSQIFTASYALQPGPNRIVLNLQIPADLYRREIFAGYTATGTQAYVVKGQKCPEDCGCYGKVLDCGCGGQSVSGADTGGTQLLFDVRCSIEQMLCREVLKLEGALIYAMGIEQILATIGSPRTNNITTVKVEQQKLLLPMYEDRYKGAIAAFVKTINLCDDCCFDCSAALNSTYVSP